MLPFCGLSSLPCGIITVSCLYSSLKFTKHFSCLLLFSLEQTFKVDRILEYKLAKFQHSEINLLKWKNWFAF